MYASISRSTNARNEISDISTVDSMFPACEGRNTGGRSYKRNLSPGQSPQELSRLFHRARLFINPVALRHTRVTRNNHCVGILACNLSCLCFCTLLSQIGGD